jgi:acyl carrier protein
MSVESMVTEAFQEAFDLPPEADVTTFSYRGHPAWTSLGHMTLVAALEARFDVMLESEDILEMSSYQKVVEIIGKYDGAN